MLGLNIRTLPKLRIILLLFLCFFSFGSVAEETDPCADMPPECRYLLLYEATDTKLNQTYKAIMSKINSGGFDGYRVEKEYIKEGLIQSQRAWLKFRDSNCNAYYRVWSGGTSRNTDEMVCLSKMTEERSQYLDRLYLQEELMDLPAIPSGLKERFQ
ncbi:lysozyme inhibitor LprI family protein [Litoribrevibacter euphylliae]|uniref:Lysozyme inhibitor LprI family protein n=1 Tax=Litoribrevibacter euphylliae TaxID=1834034 RepID=A0ABV7HF32_9GAMM